MTKLNGFICYARDDSRRVTEFHTKYLKEIEDAYDVTFWRDTHLHGGQDFNNTIEAAIGEAHLFLLLISQSWLVSEYIRKTEMPAIVKRATAADGLIVPEILELCSWEPVVRSLHALFAAKNAIEDAAKRKFGLTRKPGPLDDAAIAPGAQQDQDGSVWVVAGRRLAIAQRGGQRDEAAAGDRYVEELHVAVQEKAYALTATIRKQGASNDDGIRELALRAEQYQEQVDRDLPAMLERMVRLWTTYNELAGRWERHNRAIASPDPANRPLPGDIAQDLGALIAAAAPFMHRFPILRGYETVAATGLMADDVTSAAAALIGVAAGRALITGDDAAVLRAGLRHRADGTDVGAKAAAHALRGTRNLLVEVCALLAAKRLGRWTDADANENALFASAETVLIEAGAQDGLN